MTSVHGIPDSALRASVPFPVRWPRTYRTLATGLGPESPLLRMGTPHSSESLPDPDGLPDPTGEARFQPVPFVLRKHRDRAVALVTSRCFFYCRFCFRRGRPPGSHREPAPENWRRLLDWLFETTEIEELILSGGDPLTLSNRRLAALVRELETIPHLQRWRIHTRAPVVLPERVTPELTAALGSKLPLRIVVHTNHPAEVRPDFLGAARRLGDAGIQVLSQSVLLAGVNDAPSILEDLFRRLCRAGIHPHYLHHPDRAPGNQAFRVSLNRGLSCYRELLRLSPPGPRGVGIPPYVIDLPNGAGKCPVESLVPAAQEQGPLGTRTRYRWVRPGGWECLSTDESFEFWDVWER